MGTTEQRLQALESQVRRAQWSNRILVIALAVVICNAGAQISSPQPQAAKSAPSTEASLPKDRSPDGTDRLRTVEADRFILLDRQGRSRITMVATDEGPAISLFDENGRKRLELNQTTSATGLRLLDTKEAAVASFQARQDGDHAELEFSGPQSRSLTNATGFTVQDSAEQPRLQLALINGNFPILGISQTGQTGAASVEITAGDGTRGLKMHDKQGHPLFSVSAAEDGRTYLDMRHPEHQRSLQISTGPKNHDGPQIAFFAPAKQDGTGGLLPFLQLGLHKDQQPYIRIADNDGNPLFTAPKK